MPTDWAPLSHLSTSWNERFATTLYLIFFAFVSNIPMWIGISLLGFERHGLFCLEYAAVGIVTLYVPRLLAATIFFAVLAADLLCGVCQSYVLSPAECVNNISSLADFSSNRLVEIGRAHV